MRILDKVQTILLLTLVSLLPLQTRYIFFQDTLGGAAWEPGTFSIYAVDVLIFFLLILLIALYVNKTNKESRKNVYVVSFTVVFFLWIFISSLFSISIYLSLLGMFTFILALSLFFLISTTRITINNISIAFGIGVLWSSIIGLSQIFFQEVFSSTFFGIAGHDASMLGTSILEFHDGRFLRTYGTLSHPNIFGGFVSLGIVTFLYLTLTTERWLIRIPTLMSVPFLIFILFTTASRSAFIAVVFSLIFFLVNLFINKNFNVWKKRLYIVTGVLLGSFIVFGLVFSPILSSRITFEGRLEEKSNSERMDSYLLWPAVTEGSLVIGLGTNTYRRAVAKNDSFLQPAWAYQPVHSAYLLLLGELGIIGFSLLFIFIIIGIETISPIIRKGNIHALYVYSLLIIIMLSSIFDHYWFSTHFGLLTFFFIFGLLFRFTRKSLKG